MAIFGEIITLGYPLCLSLSYVSLVFITSMSAMRISVMFKKALLMHIHKLHVCFLTVGMPIVKQEDEEEGE